MTRLFVQLYTVIIASMVLVGALVGVFIMMTVVPERNAQLSRWLEHPLSQLATQIREHPEQRDAIIQDYEERTGASIELTPIAEVSCIGDEETRKLERGEVVLDGSYFAYVGLDPEHTLAINLYPNRPFRWLPAVAIMLSLLLTGIGVWYVIRPVRKRLTVLADTASHFGEGHFDARTQLEGSGPVEALGHQFDRMAEQVQVLVESREELLRAVSHELRTPLSRLFFATSLIEGAESEVERSELVESLQETLEEMRGLTSELLTFARLSNGTPDLERVPCPLAEIASDAAGQLTPAPNKSLSLDATPLTVDGDPHLLQRALRNLLSNAQRHARSRIELHIEAEGEHALIHIDDDGYGVPPEDRERILKPFVRLEESRCRDHGGSGIGLAIVTRVAQRHGGSVQITDSPLGGARFTLRI